MTLEELIKKLQELKSENPHLGNLRVTMSHPAHDYWRNTLASDVEEIDQAVVKYSAYHESDKVVDDIDESIEDVEPVILLR